MVSINLNESVNHVALCASGIVFPTVLAAKKIAYHPIPQTNLMSRSVTEMSEVDCNTVCSSDPGKKTCSMGSSPFLHVQSLR